MAQLWIRDHDNVWAVLPLAGRVVSLTTDGPRLVDKPAVSSGSRGIDAAVFASINGGGENDGRADWVLLARAGVRVDVNGLPLGTGLRLLRHQDEVRVDDAGTFFFSAETLPEIVPYPDDGQSRHCPRCKDVLKPGTPAVRCPCCALWYHQTDDMPCWTYGSRCGACDHPTAMDVGFRWSPEDL